MAELIKRAAGSMAISSFRFAMKIPALTYKDLQEDKEGMFDTVDTIQNR